MYLIGSECGGRNVEAFEIQCDKDDSTGDERPRSLLPKGLECIRDGTRKLEVDSTKGNVKAPWAPLTADRAQSGTRSSGNAH